MSYRRFALYMYLINYLKKWLGKAFKGILGFSVVKYNALFDMAPKRRGNTGMTHDTAAHRAIASERRDKTRKRRQLRDQRN